jgi:formylglycine-generating enzyme required for sulfatase activity
LWLPVASLANRSKAESTRRVAGTVETNPADGLEYIWIPPGTFLLGCSPEDSDCYRDESPTVLVEISRGFWLGRKEVSVGAWERVMKEAPRPAIYAGIDLNPGSSRKDLPVVNVTWAMADRYCGSALGRLPTEAEWEYAARAGTSQARYGRVTEVAWYANNSGRQWIDADRLNATGYSTRLATNGNRPHSVDSALTNSWSLYSMLGNVAEWVADDYGDRTYATLSERAKAVDPLHKTGSSLVTHKVVRGGSWYDIARHVRSSSRHAVHADSAYLTIGFRCIWNKPESQ